MIKFGLSRCVSRIVTVTDLRMERILRRAGRPRAQAAHRSPRACRSRRRRATAGWRTCA
ncbi:hypothetical protein NKI67_33290, partial [Mesorhizobium sp. M0408]